MTEIQRLRLVKIHGRTVVPPDSIRVDRATRWGNPFQVLGGKIMQLRNVPMGYSMAKRMERERQWRNSQLSLPIQQGRHMLLTEGKWVIPARPGFVCPTVEDVRRELKGRNLADWAAPDEPSWADVLMEIANDWPTCALVLGQHRAKAALQEAVEQAKQIRRRG
jgi:hypothetical protein